jgi:hypothetical protein
MPDRLSPLSDRSLMHHAYPAANYLPMIDPPSAISEITGGLRMKFLSSKYKKYVAAAAAAFAAIAVPAQAGDCSTYCHEQARQAGQTAANQAQSSALQYCLGQYYAYGRDVNGCMYSKVPEIDAAYNAAYQQTYNQCMGSCS